MAFGDEFVLAARAFMAHESFGFRRGTLLGGRLNDRGPAIFALGTGHNDHVARGNRLGVGDGLDGLELDEFRRAIAFGLRKGGYRQPRQASKRNDDEQAGRSQTGSIFRFHNFYLVVRDRDWSPTPAYAAGRTNPRIFGGRILRDFAGGGVMMERKFRHQKQRR